MVAKTLEAFGRVDILHNNAVHHTVEQRQRDLDVCNIEADTWRRAMEVNALGPLLCSKHVIPHMIAQGGGSLIHASSGFGLLGDVTLTCYGMSKAAIQLMSKSIAVQYGKQGVRSNVIACGMVLTDMAQTTTPDVIKEMMLKEHSTPYLGAPRHIADTVAFLASDEAAFITGQTLAVDGGFTTHSPAATPLRDYLAQAGAI
jgi:NAD(P)-dependent dehydrogenase (short-subunit alcohol dehydrogenase family)